MKSEQLPLVLAIQRYLASNRLRMHTPGHKGRPEQLNILAELFGSKAFDADLTEAEGLDSLMNPTGAIRDALSCLATVYNASWAGWSTNGATGAIIAAVTALTSPGTTLVMPRFAHRSVFQGLMLSGAMPHFLPLKLDKSTGLPLPLYDLPPEIAEIPAPTLLLTRPTYEGLAAAINDQVVRVHGDGGRVIVDEAHGGHLYWGEHSAQMALPSGADVVIHSPHKQMGSLTGTGWVLSSDARIGRRIEKSLQYTHTSSPSYLLMASLDAARGLWQESGNELAGKVCSCRDWLLNHLSREAVGLLYTPDGAIWQDPGKLVISTEKLGMTGAQVAAYLRAQGIEPELAGGRHVLLILTYSDGLAEIKRLASVLDGLAKKHSSAELLSPLLEQPPLPQSPAITPREAILAPAREVLLTESGGEISASLVTPYPPGIPILIPGERISPEVAEYLANTNKMGTHLAGVVRSKAGPLIEVVE